MSVGCGGKSLHVLACQAADACRLRRHLRAPAEFDNRGSKVMSKDTSAKIMKALAEHAFLVPAGKVVQVGGVGQSNIVNHKSTVIYAATGPASNGKSVLANCQVRAGVQAIACPAHSMRIDATLLLSLRVPTTDCRQVGLGLVQPPLQGPQEGHRHLGDRRL